MRCRATVGAVVLSACSSAPSIPFSEFAARKLEAQCTRYVSCGVFESDAACQAYFFLIPDTSLAAAVGAKTVRYDGVSAKRCVDAVAKLSCDGTSAEARTPPAACVKVFTGTIAAGDACALDLECKVGSCVPTSATCDPSMCCDATCAIGAPAAIGEMCHVDLDCATGAYCGTDHLCHALGQDNDTCVVDAQCDVGLGCIDTTFPGLCHPLAGDGEACPYGRCADIGDACIGGICVPAGLAGAPCTGPGDCSSTETCDTAAGLCADLPDVGAACSGRCEGDAFCDPNGQCAARLDNTTPCNADSECITGYCAEGAVFDACDDRPVCY